MRRLCRAGGLLCTPATNYPRYHAKVSSSNVFSLNGKTALVTGASRGIGLAIAKELARAGASTILTARSLDSLEREAKALLDEGLSALPLVFDVAAPAWTVIDSIPQIDILVNVAGTNIRKNFLDYTRQEYDRLMETNLHGLVAVTQHVGRKMIDRGKGGKIVSIGSLMSLVGLPYLSVYAMTKSALAGLTRTLAAEWARHNIQVNCIAPGFILTDLNRSMWQLPVMAEWLSGAQANPRMGTPEDIAPLAVLLSGPGSDYITGQVIAVDGGYTTTANWPFEP
ncbi:MAG: SDR family oxidoreductase [Bryobacteraceae bacterium]